MASNGNGSSLGLRNWRGQIVEPLANFAAADVAPDEQNEVAARKEATEDSSDSEEDGKRDPKKHRKKHSTKKKKKDAKKRRRRSSEDEVFVKDEFGRDVPLKKSTKRHNKRSRSRERSRSRSPRDKSRRRSLTPPPADPYRPQLDENRYQTLSRYRRSRSRSRERSRHRSRTRSRSRSRDRGRHDRRDRRSKSTDRVWTHDGFQNRSPSPMREIQAGYRPEPEQWVSRAGGVYVPRKPQ